MKTEIKSQEQKKKMDATPTPFPFAGGLKDQKKIKKTNKTIGGLKC